MNDQQKTKHQGNHGGQREHNCIKEKALHTRIVPELRHFIVSVYEYIY